ncbi:MAG: hypothetical protein KDE63_07275 [Novosphingobium sp.]|nr:hypothetical protein [Novosphingobium sp.]MCC2097380.1 hypothetical protein [Hyphomicrobiales bacterium]
MNQNTPILATSGALVLDQVGDISAPAPKTDLPPLRFELEQYRRFIEDEGLPEEQAQELLGAIWLIIARFVDIGFRLDPVQMIEDAKASSVGEKKPSLEADSRPVVSCRKAFNKVAKPTPVRRKRRAGRRKDS